jgi:hypothetical protein
LSITTDNIEQAIERAGTKAVKRWDAALKQKRLRTYKKNYNVISKKRDAYSVLLEKYLKIFLTDKFIPTFLARSVYLN